MHVLGSLRATCIKYCWTCNTVLSALLMPRVLQKCFITSLKWLPARMQIEILVTIYCFPYLTHATLWQLTMRWQCKLCQLFGVIGCEIYCSHMGVNKLHYRAAASGGLVYISWTTKIMDTNYRVQHPPPEFVGRQSNLQQWWSKDLYWQSKHLKHAVMLDLSSFTDPPQPFNVAYRKGWGAWYLMSQPMRLNVCVI